MIHRARTAAGRGARGIRHGDGAHIGHPRRRGAPSRDGGSLILPNPLGRLPESEDIGAVTADGAIALGTRFTFLGTAGTTRVVRCRR